MEKKRNNSQNGAISVFVMITMIFFLLTIIGAYMISSKRAQTQTQSVKLMQDKYYEAEEENTIYQDKIASLADIIPIYTKEQFWSIGTGKAVQIEGKTYTFSNNANYQLQNDIVININELDVSKTTDDSKITKNNYEIYYYYNGNYYELATSSPFDLSMNGYNFKNKNLSKDLGYETDGLLLHYDGIRNTAVGHSSSATVWKDLSGNKNDGILTSFGNQSWKENGLVFDGIDDYLSDVAVSNAEGLTIQIVMKNDVTTEYRNIYDRYNAQAPMLWLNPNSRFEFSTDYTLEQDYSTKTIAVTNAMTRNTSNMYINGNKVKEDFNHSKEIEGTYQLFNRGATQTYKGEVYSVRIYQKCLTDQQIQTNYAIDKVRFDIE